MFGRTRTNTGVRYIRGRVRSSLAITSNSLPEALSVKTRKPRTRSGTRPTSEKLSYEDYFFESENDDSDMMENGDEIADFTLELDDCSIPELIQAKEEPGVGEKLIDRRLKENENHNYKRDQRGWFICPYCPRSMKQSSNLRTHVMIHTGEKPWKCKYCDERFTQAGDRGLHMRRYHSDILGTIKCNFCTRYFDPKKLNAHILKSHPKKAFPVAY